MTLDYASWVSPCATPRADVMTMEPSVLSVRERRVFWLLVAGATVPEIVQEMHISPHTVKSYRTTIARKIPGARRVSGMAALATELLLRSG